MQYKRLELIKLYVLLMSVIFLYMTLKEANLALHTPTAIAQSSPCTTASPSPSPSALPSTTPSPAQSPTPPPFVPIHSIYLTEFMACPASGTEWLELYNGGETSVEINNWQVIDKTNNKKLISGSIPPHSFTVFEWSGSLLNNTGDSFTVFTSGSEEVTTAEYANCTTGISFVYDNGQWVGALESAGEQTVVSETSITTGNSTKSATLASPASHDPSDEFPISTISFSDTATTDPFLDFTFNYNLPTILTSTSSETISNSITPQLAPHTSELPYGPLVSVIMGGLLQLVPAGSTFYEQYLKSRV